MISEIYQSWLILFIHNPNRYFCWNFVTHGLMQQAENMSPIPYLLLPYSANFFPRSLPFGRPEDRNLGTRLWFSCSLLLPVTCWYCCLHQWKVTTLAWYRCKKEMKYQMISNDLETGKTQSSDTNMAPYVTDRKKFAVCFLGIFISYFYYGIIQEKM